MFGSFTMCLLYKSEQVCQARNPERVLPCPSKRPTGFTDRSKVLLSGLTTGKNGFLRRPLFRSFEQPTEISDFWSVKVLPGGLFWTKRPKLRSKDLPGGLKTSQAVFLKDHRPKKRFPTFSAVFWRNREAPHSAWKGGALAPKSALKRAVVVLTRAIVSGTLN